LLSNSFFKIACTNCGMCDTLASNSEEDYDEIRKEASQSDIFSSICPGVGINRSSFNLDHNNYHPLIEGYVDVYTGFSNNSNQRISSSSGGVITEILCYLLDEGLVDYVCLPLPSDNTEVSHTYQLSNNTELIRTSAQSIYTKVPAWGVIKKIKSVDGKIAFVGLPDQISSLRSWQILDEGLRKKIKLFIGPMVGIGMDKSVVEIIPKIAKNNSGIKKLRWRYGEWPGYLRVEFNDSKVIKLHKFYYNYMLPFYCSHESLLSDDFSNECADISVGDAWSPKYEKLGKGWSVVWSKTKTGDQVLNSMAKKNLITLNKIRADDAISMHEHMLDFKKRGSKYRAKIYKFFGKSVPAYYSPDPNFSLARYFIEIIIVGTIWLCRTRFSRFILPFINQKLMGYIFSNLRIIWKRFTKKIKRKGLDNFGEN
jgi:coenzyme F420 hydrogenase subunit beta